MPPQAKRINNSYIFHVLMTFPHSTTEHREDAEMVPIRKGGEFATVLNIGNTSAANRKLIRLLVVAGRIQIKLS